MSMGPEPPLTSSGSLSIYRLNVQPQLDWASSGDEFFARLATKLGELTGGTVYERRMKTVTSDTHLSYRRYSFKGAGLTTALALVPRADHGWLIGVEASEHSSALRDAPIWSKAISAVVNEVGGVEQHEWWSILFPTSFADGVVRLDCSQSHGAYHLTPSPRTYARLKEQFPRTLSRGGAVEVGYLVVAQGRSQGYDTEAAMRRASQGILDLCAALTLDTGLFWEVLEQAQPARVSPENLPLAEDDSLSDLGSHDHVVKRFAPTPLTAELLEEMANNLDVRELVVGFYHGASIERRSPSLATVMYVGIVETIGSRIEPLSRCTCCDACNKREGYARQFRAALRLVLPQQEAKRLSNLYSKRSKTAHQARLHGMEHRHDWIANTFQPDESHYFLYAEVLHIKAAAASLLRLLVDERLPSPETK